MTFDGIFTKWMMDEVAPLLVGGRITKIHQPLPYDVQLWDPKGPPIAFNRFFELNS